jgi:hypothetical protein
VNRPARIAGWTSIASLLGIVPHVMEDLRYGQAVNFHMTTAQFEWFAGAVVLASAGTAMLCLEGWRSGAVGVLLFGVLWSVLGAIDHHRAFLPGTFRAGLSSRVWVFLIVGLQAVAALAAGLALLRAGQTERAVTPPPA